MDKIVSGFCMKCREKVNIKDMKETSTVKGTAMIKGVCPVCGTVVCRMGKPS